MSSASSASVAVIGLGFQGCGIADLLIGHGFTLAGAVDVGDKVGKPLRELVAHADTPDLPVFGSLDDLIAKSGKPALAVIAVAVHAHDAADLAASVLKKGIHVATLTEDLFEGEGELVAMLDKVAKDNGVTMFAGGLQDAMWVSLPSVAAASVSHLERVTLDDFADSSIFSWETGRLDAGMGMDDAEFAEWKAERLAEPPMQGAPLRVLARVLGFTPTETHYQIEPFKSAGAVYWSGAERSVPAGNALGARLHVTIRTQEGVTFEGKLVFKLLEEGETQGNAIILKGRETLTLNIPNPDYPTLVWLGLLRRIDEVLAAKPGFLFVKDLPPQKYVHPVQ